MGKWTEKTLGEVTAYLAKGIPPKYVDVISSDTIYVLNQKCNRNFEISYEPARMHDLSKKNVADAKMLLPGDVLINSTGVGTAGRIAQIWDIPYPTTTDGHMITIRPTSEVDPLFYGYAVKAYQKQIETLAEGSTGQTELNKTRLQNEIIIRYPESKEEQHNIAVFLENIDKKIAVNVRINRNLEEQGNSVYKSWFVDFSINDYEKPNLWSVGTIDDVTTLVTRGITPKYIDDSEELVINQKCIRNHVIDLSLARGHRPKVVNNKRLCFGDLLVNSTGTGTLGRAAQVWFEPQNLTVDSHVTIVRPKSLEWIYYIGFWGLNNERTIEALHTGSTGQTELPRDRVKKIPILLPDEITLTKFSEIIEPITSKIVLNQRENIRLSQLRDSFLPKIISGELDILDLDI